MVLTKLVISHQYEVVCVTGADRFRYQYLVIPLTNQVSYYTTHWSVMMTFSHVVKTLVKVFSNSPFSGLESSIW